MCVLLSGSLFFVHCYTSCWMGSRWYHSQRWWWQRRSYSSCNRSCTIRWNTLKCCVKHLVGLIVACDMLCFQTLFVKWIILYLHPFFILNMGVVKVVYVCLYTETEGWQEKQKSRLFVVSQTHHGRDHHFSHFPSLPSPSVSTVRWYVWQLSNVLMWVAQRWATTLVHSGKML